jgi:hypothetical protein
MRTSFHHQPEAQHPNFQLSTSWQADYPICWHIADVRDGRRFCLLSGKRRHSSRIQRLNGKPIFRLTRVTRIFEKSAFTETTPEARAACRAGFFVARTRVRPRAAGFACLQKNRKIQEITAMQFQRGQSGNPSGRPRGSLNRATVLAQELLAARVESIAGKLIELAEGGDMRAIRVCMDRLAPVIKHQPIAVELPPMEKPADSVEAAASIAAAVAAGELTATEAAELAKVVDVYVGALASRGFDERLSKLEKEIGSAPAVAAHAAACDGTAV